MKALKSHQGRPVAIVATVHPCDSANLVILWSASLP